jgi:molecular chaperone DnaK
LGGGTFDVSIVDLSFGVMEVLASDGDTELGGADFDLMIAQSIKTEFLTEHGIDLSKKPLSWLRVLRASEEAKIRLSKEAEVEIVEEFIEEKDGVPLHLKTRLTRADFEGMIRGVLERTLQCVRRALKQASCDSSILDRVVLVGGSTYIPLVSQMLEEELHIVPQAWLNPETVVAQGAAIEAASLTGESLGTIMLDVTPHSLGLKCLNQYNMPENVILIHRNSSLPGVASRLFYKQYTEQECVEIAVYQGESTKIEEVTEIGNFKLDGLEDSEDPEICVKFEIDRSGLLQVTATDIGLSKKVVRTIQRKGESLTVSKNLADLKALRLHLEDTESTIETVEVESSQEEPSSSLSEDLIKKALAILEKKTLPPVDAEDLQSCVDAVKSGESPEKLEEILYYLE